MYNKYLEPLYKIILNSDFDYEYTEHRLLMQYVIYLCLTLGIPIGNYGFRYTTKGPISYSLIDDMAYKHEHPDYNPPAYHFELDQYSQKKIKDIKNIIAAGTTSEYSVKDWLECVCSIVHLRKFVLLSANTDTTALFEKMKQYQPHLNDSKANQKAYELVKDL